MLEMAQRDPRVAAGFRDKGMLQGGGPVLDARIPSFHNEFAREGRCGSGSPECIHAVAHATLGPALPASFFHAAPSPMHPHLHRQSAVPMASLASSTASDSAFRFNVCLRPVECLWLMKKSILLILFVLLEGGGMEPCDKKV